MHTPSTCWPIIVNHDLVPKPDNDLLVGRDILLMVVVGNILHVCDEHSHVCLCFVEVLHVEGVAT